MSMAVQQEMSVIKYHHPKTGGRYAVNFIMALQEQWPFNGEI